MSDFVQETKDIIEQSCGSQITKLFPNYSVFWEEFIGDPRKDVPIAYGLIFPSDIEAERQEAIVKIYDEICMAHYSLFCHLAGTHFQQENMKRILKLDDFKRKYFEHWETFEVCYFHLGSAFFQMYHLWGLIFLLRNEITRDERGHFHPSVKTKLKDYLQNNNQNSLCGRIDTFDEEIKNLRDNIVHFSRVASEVHFGEFYIPKKIEPEAWKEQHETEEWLETSKKTKIDLEETEKLINSIQDFLIRDFRDFLTTNKIKINRQK
jgi:hypothetical protein